MRDDGMRGGRGARGRWVVLVILGLVLGACSPGEPAVSPEDQVAAEDRPEETEGGGGTAAPAGDVTGTFVAVDIAYSEAPAQVPAGDNVFELVNEGNLEHNVVLEELGDELVVEAMGGETATGDATIDPGTYTYYCSIPGHREAGMEGTLEAA